MEDDEVRCPTCGHLSLEHRTGECVHIIPAERYVWKCACPSPAKRWKGLRMREPFYPSFSSSKMVREMTTYPIPGLDEDAIERLLKLATGTIDIKGTFK